MADSRVGNEGIPEALTSIFHTPQSFSDAIVDTLTARDSFTATLTNGPSQNQQQQIDALRSELAALRVELHDATQASDKRFAETEDKLSREGEARAKGDKDERSFVTNLQAGGLNLSAFGAGCLLIGIAMGGWPQEIADLAHRILG
jgi:hypothetical protein